jgi:hypothetical protein
VKKTIIALLLLAGCLPEEKLPVKTTGKMRDYFIECYCQPDREFMLTVTRVLPLAGELDPDFNIPLEVTIIAGKSIPMIFQLFQTSGGFVYNYGNRERLAPYGVDTLYLNVLTPDQGEITAKTIVPSPVTIDSARVEEAAATIYFQTSRNPEENYYLYILQPFDKDGPLERESCFLDYSALSPASPVERAIPYSPAAGTTRVHLILRRLTRSCYDYQISLNEANSAQHGSITTPVPLAGNITGALGIFTCYTEDTHVWKILAK